MFATASRARRLAHLGLTLCLAVSSALAGAELSPARAADPEHGFLTGTQEGGGGYEVQAVVTPDPVPAGFIDRVVLGGLTLPTAVEFASDGRVFVIEKAGRLKIFDSLSDTTPTTALDISGEVNSHWDRGLAGLALHPNFPATPYVYLLFTYDAPLGQTAPVWNDTCPDPPRSQTDGCVVSGRLIRITVNTSNVASGRVNLISNEWCQQFPSHSVDDLEFGPDGMLYVSAGEGANFNTSDYGQFGGSLTGTPTPANPCGDPPGGVGTALTPPDATGGSLRSQSPRRNAAYARSLDGAILRIDPATGAGAAGNPFAGSSDANARRILAYGLRNPFRMVFRPGTSELWIGDVGQSETEEIDVLTVSSTAENFGWPCYEGSTLKSGFSGLTLCSSLAQSATEAPRYSYSHGGAVVPGDGCPTSGSSALSGVAFYNGGAYPDRYDGALFFADYARNCMWVILPGGNGAPNPSTVEVFESPSSVPVDIVTGPGGDLFYVDIGDFASPSGSGSVHRISYEVPNAVASASPTYGPLPLNVSFNGTGSTSGTSDPGLTYAWDLDGDGQYDDSSSATPSRIYGSAGTVTVRLQVTNTLGASSVSPPIVLQPGNQPPSVTIGSVKVGGTTYAPPPAFMTDPAPASGIAPSGSRVWTVGAAMQSTGSASDPQDGTLSGAALSWSLVMNHCPGGVNCHAHQVQSGTGTSISFSAPDHEWPSYLRLTLTATDGGGLTASKSVNLYPKSATVSLTSSPAGAGVQVDGAGASATVIVGHEATLSAPTSPVLGGTLHRFSSWSDGSTSAVRGLTVGTGGASLVARYVSAFSRLFGANRYATAVAISKDTYPTPGVPVAYVATGLDFPDALAAAAAAGHGNGPLLLVPGTYLPSDVRTELDRLNPQRIVILGGTAVVSSAVENAVKAYDGAGGTKRLFGANRYATAVAISKDTYPTPGVPVAYVATGLDFPDALAAAAAAGHGNGPLLLVPGTYLPSDVRTELDRLNPQRIVILGGTAVVSSAVENAVKAYDGAGGTKRLFGANRYATAVAISKDTYPTPGVPVAYVATGLDFPDALAAAAAAGHGNGPLLLVPGTYLPSDVRTELDRLNPQRIVILGGTAVVSSAVENAVKPYIAP